MPTPPLKFAVAGPGAIASPSAVRAKKTYPILHHIGFGALLGLLFVTFSRLAETLAVQLGANLRIALGLLLFTTVCAVLLGRPLERFNNKMAFLLIGLTAWFLVCVPTSVHRGGSVQHLISYWFSTLLLALSVLCYAEDAKSLRRMLYAVVAGTLLVAFVRATDSGFTVGALGNPNLYGQHLLYGVPFLLLPVFRHGFGSVRGLLAVGCAGVLVAKVFFTGSRSSLLAIMAVLFIVFLQLPAMKKMVLVLLAIPASILFVVNLPEEARLRYSTILNEDLNRPMTEIELSAIESSRARKIHFEQSVDLTIENPLLGVGPGMFAVAAADDSKSRGERALWKETHNSYTQISSETGIPGLIIYLGILVLTITSAMRTRRLSRHARPGSELFELRHIAGALLVSLLAMFITGIFSSSAYMPYFPLLGCFAMAGVRLAAKEAEASPSAMASVAPPARPALPLVSPPARPRPAFRA